MGHKMLMCHSLLSPDFVSILEVEPASLFVVMCSVLSPALYGHKPWSHLPSSPPSDSSVLNSMSSVLQKVVWEFKSGGECASQALGSCANI